MYTSCTCVWLYTSVLLAVRYRILLLEVLRKYLLIEHSGSAADCTVRYFVLRCTAVRYCVLHCTADDERWKCTVWRKGRYSYFLKQSHICVFVLFGLQAVSDSEVQVTELGDQPAARSTIYCTAYLLTGGMGACSDINVHRPPSGDGAAISGVHRHVGLLQERPGGIGAANGDIETLPRRCHNRQ